MVVDLNRDDLDTNLAKKKPGSDPREKFFCRWILNLDIQIGSGSDHFFVNSDPKSLVTKILFIFQMLF